MQTLAHTLVHTLIPLLWGFLPRHGTPIGLCLMQLLQCQLAVQTLCLFVEVEGTGFSRKASQALPLLSCYLSPASQMEAGRGGGEEGTDEETQNGGEEVTQGREEEEEGESSAAMETDAAEGILCNDRCPLVEPSLGADTEPPVAHDHLLFTTLTCLGKMLSACSALIRSPALQVSMNEIWGKLMLLYVCTQHGCCSHAYTRTLRCFPCDRANRSTPPTSACLGSSGLCTTHWSSLCCLQARGVGLWSEPERRVPPGIHYREGRCTSQPQDGLWM